MLQTEERLSPAEFKFVEHKLYTYPVNKQVIEDVAHQREDILLGTPTILEGGRGSSPSDPTQSKTVQLLLMEHKAQREYHWCRAIESFMEILTEEDRCLVERKYWRQMTNVDVAASLCMSESTFKRRRQRIVWMLANRLGIT